MPTQATANAMYHRQRNAIRALFDESSALPPSLVLAHSQSRMHDGFRATVIDEPALKRARAQTEDADEPSEISCAAFLANSSRAALIADVGAGTVDQAILAVLPSKFNTMRLFGLAEKVLLLDEIHAYDSYMAEELCALLRFHAALGGSVIALSATLPSKLTADLIDSWRMSSWPRAVLRNQDVLSSSYPLATAVTSDGTLTQSPIELSPCRGGRSPCDLYTPWMMSSQRSPTRRAPARRQSGFEIRSIAAAKARKCFANAAPRTSRSFTRALRRSTASRVSVTCSRASVPSNAPAGKGAFSSQRRSSSNRSTSTST